jgi:hypothetical protein
MYDQARESYAWLGSCLLGKHDVSKDACKLVTRYVATGLLLAFLERFADCVQFLLHYLVSLLWKKFMASSVR